MTPFCDSFFFKAAAVSDRCFASESFASWLRRLTLITHNFIEREPSFVLMDSTKQQLDSVVDRLVNKLNEREYDK